MPERFPGTVESIEESSIEDIDEAFKNASRLGISARDQIKTPEGQNAEVLGGSKTEKGKIYYRIEGDTEIRFFIAKNKQQVKEQGFTLTRPARARRGKEVKSSTKEAENVISYEKYGARYTIGTSDEDMAPFSKELNLGVGDTVTSAAFGTGTVIGIIKEANSNRPRGETLPVGELLVDYPQKEQLSSYGVRDARILLGINPKKDLESREDYLKEVNIYGERALINISPEEMRPYTEGFGINIGDKIKINGDERVVVGVLDKESKFYTSNIGQLIASSFSGESWDAYNVEKLRNADIAFIEKSEEQKKENNGEVEGEAFLKEFFEKIGSDNDGSWGWDISDDGKYIRMNYGIEDGFRKLIAKQDNLEDISFLDTDDEKGELFEKVKGKKVIGVDYRGDLYLEILGENESEKTEENIKTYENRRGETYMVDTSDEAFAPYAKLFNFKIGDVIEEARGQEVEVLGICSGGTGGNVERGNLLVRSKNTGDYDDGYISRSIAAASSERFFEKYLKSEQNIKTYEEEDGGKYFVDISDSKMRPYTESFGLKVGDRVNVDDGRGEGEVVGVLAPGGTDFSTYTGELFIKFDSGYFYPYSESEIKDYFIFERPQNIESKQGAGEDPEIFLNDFFDLLEETSFNKRDAWSWEVSRDGKYIDMNLNTGSIPEPNSFVIEKLNELPKDIEFLENQRGVDGIKKILEGKQVRGVDIQGSFFLEVVSRTDLEKPKESVGEDPEVLVNNFFKTKSPESSPAESWRWGFSEDGKYINMQFGVDETAPGIVTKAVESIPSNFSSGEPGKTALLEKLQGKRVVGVNYNDRFYLEIIDVPESEKTKGGITTYETGRTTYKVDTSIEAFKEFSDQFDFTIGQELRDRDGDGLKILGISDGDLFVKYNNPSYGDRGFSEFSLNDAKLRLEGYIKPVILNEFLSKYPFIQEITVSTKPQDLKNFQKKFKFTIGEEFIDKDGDSGVVLGVITESADSSSKGRLLLKYTGETPSYIYADEEDVAIYLEEKSAKEQAAEIGIKHKESLIAKADRLKNSRPFQALADLIAHDPNFKSEYRIMLERLKEFKKEHQTPEERHRAYTGMLSSIMMSERLSDLFERVIDRTVEEESDEIKESIKSGENYSYEVVLGTGVHGTIYNIARQMYVPEVPSLTTDQNKKIGGQFGQYGGDAFRLNSRTRRETRGKDYLPGSGQTLNTFTEYATMQPSDMTAMSYSFQSVLGRNARTNFFLSGRAATELELQKVYRNTEGGYGKLLLEFLDKSSNKLVEIENDRLILASGLGKELTRLDENDPETRRILVEEEDLYENGGQPRVISFTKFVQWMTDEKNPFPQKDMKRVIISGSGDSGAVIAGMLLGYEAQYGKTTTQLDAVEEITWLGQQIETKEKFLETIRTRYAQVGLEFPREKVENYYSRIKPVASKSRRLERTVDGIAVITEDGKSFEGDHFIYAHGFKDTTDEVVGSYFNREYRDQESIENQVRNLLSLFGSGNEIYYKTNSSGLKKIEVLESDARTATIRIVQDNGSFDVQSVVLNRLDAQFYKKYLSPISIRKISVKDERAVGTTNVYDPDISSESPIALQYRNRRNEEIIPIYKAGPSSKLPLTQEEIRRSPALANIPENTAAVFRYAKYTEALAGLLAKSDNASEDATFKIRQSLTAKLRRKNIEETDIEIQKGFLKDKNSSFAVLTGKKEILSYNENLNDTLRFAIGEFFEKYKFGNENVTVEVNIEKEGDFLYSGTIKPSLENEVLIENLINSSLVGAVLDRMTEQKNNKSRKVTLRIPFVEGRVDSANITSTVPR